MRGKGVIPFFQSMLRSWSTILEANAAKMVKTTVPTDPKLSLSWLCFLTVFFYSCPIFLIDESFSMYLYEKGLACASRQWVQYAGGRGIGTSRHGPGSERCTESWISNSFELPTTLNKKAYRRRIPRTTSQLVEFNKEWACLLKAGTWRFWRTYSLNHASSVVDLENPIRSHILDQEIIAHPSVWRGKHWNKWEGNQKHTDLQKIELMLYVHSWGWG